MLRLLRLAAPWLVLLGAGAWVIFECSVNCATLPEQLRRPLRGSPVLLDCHGKLLAELPSREARLQFPVPFSEMSPWLAKATVALEDRRYRSHGGVDITAIMAACVRNLSHGRVISGASTITQQLVKNSQPLRPRSLGTKISEAFTAIHLEREWTKEAILERYLNQVEYGNRFRGVEAAARRYFGVSAASLSPQQAIYLAGLPQAPTRYNPWTHPQAAAERYQRSLQTLGAAGVISASELAAWQETPQILPRAKSELKAPHYVSQVRRLHPELEGRIACTLDLGLQTQLESIVKLHLQRLQGNEVHDVAVVVMDHQTGDVLAWCGSAGWNGPRGMIDGVVLPRSSGSILKPFLYLQALEQRVLTAASLLPDTPDAIRTQYFDYDPRNYDQRFWGPVRVREALANSLNVPAVVTLAKLGARQAFEGLRHAGIRTARDFEDYGAGLILGNAEVRLLDVTSAFGAFANQGTFAMPRFLAESPPRNRSIASPEATQIIADILCDNDARRKSFGPFTPLAFDQWRIPCKTGTSSGFRDAWTIGATAKHVVGVWLGNFSGKPMREVASVTGPAPLWRDVMQHLFARDAGVAAPQASDKLISCEVCATTGLLPSAASPERITEWFLPGTVPTHTADDMYVRTDTGFSLELPPEYEVWCRSSHNHLGAKVKAASFLRIVHPMDGARFMIDAALPLNRQKLRFQAAGGSGDLQWRLDGTPLSPHEDGGGFLWMIQRGSHRLQVSDKVSTREVQFTVE